MSSSNKVALAKLCKRHYHVLPITNHRHRYLLSRCLSSVFTTLSARKAKQSMAFGLLLLTGIFTTPLSAQITTGICDRTPEVRRAILDRFFLAPDCADVTATDLARITILNVNPLLGSINISTLQSDDFAGLTGLTALNLSNSGLTELPAGIFAGLTSLTTLSLGYDPLPPRRNSNNLMTLPAGVFNDLTSLTGLDLGGNDLTMPSATIFNALTNLTILDLRDNNIDTLDAGVFSTLTSLTELYLSENSLSTLPDDIFDSLTSLTELHLFDNNLMTLPAGVFDMLTSLTILDLDANDLTALPANVFDNLMSLTLLDLRNNNLMMLPANIFDPVSSADIIIDLSPIGDLPDIALDTGDTTPIDVSGAFISRNVLGSDRIISFSATSDNPAVATVSLSGGVVTIRGVAAGSTNVTITANDRIGTATQTISVTVDAGIVAYDAMMDGNPISTTTIVEASGTGTLYVQLASQPATGSSVTISVASSDTNEGTVTPPTLTFSDTNWDTRKPVTVTAVDDNVVRDDSFTVDFAVMMTTDTTNYPTSLVIPSVTVTVTDDDTAGIALFDMATGTDAPSITTTEGATTDSFYVALTSQPTGTVTVTISGLRAEEHVLPPLFGTTFTFTPTGGATPWDTRQAITLTGVDDDFVDGNQMYDLTLTPTGGGYDSVTPETVSVTNTDDDTAELTIADMSVNEDAGTATVTVTLTPAVTAGDVMVDATTADGTATIAGGDYTAITSQTLTFRAGSTTQTLDIPINDDSIAEGDEAFTVMLDNLIQPTGVTTVSIATDDTAEVTITDDDVPGLRVDIGDGVTTSEGSATPGTFTVVLNTQPTADVTVTISGLVTTEHSLTPSTTLTFTTTNWSTAQTVTLNSVDDNVVDGDQSYTITLTSTSTDTNYNALTQTVSVTNSDTDTAVLTIADMSVGEGDGTATVTVTLSTMVTTGDVTVQATTADVTATAGADYTAITSQTLTFTAGSTTQTLDITINDDSIAEGNEAFTVMLGGLSAPTGVTIATDNTATVTITDDETTPTAITLSVTPSTVVETADATEITVTATLEGTAVLPTATDVAVSVGGGTATSGTDYTAVPNFTLTIPALSLSATGTFMIDPADDGTGDNNETVMISGTAPGFTTINAATLTISEAGISVFDVASGGTSTNTITIADENSGTMTFYVRLISAPASDVTLTLTSSDTNEGTVTPATLTFTATPGTTSWDTRQALTVTAVPDDIDRDDTFTVDFAVMTGDGGNYPTTLTIPSVTVTITDDDTAGIALFDAATGSDAPSITTTEGATTDSFYVVLESEPTGTVTVTISGLVAGEHTSVPPSTLTFTPTGTTIWNTRQVITLTGVDDSVVDGDQMYDITLTPTGGGYDSVTAPTVSITNSDDDTAAISIADLTIDENAGTATLTVTLTPAVTAGDVMVDLTTRDGTATIAGGDYTAFTSETLIITEGSTTQTLDIPINNDNIDELDETFTVTLDNLMLPAAVTGDVSITDATAMVTITDDDTLSNTINLSVSPSTVAETADATTITVTATIEGTAVSPTDTTVTVSVGGGTATSGTDYADVTGFTLNIPAGMSSGMTTFMIDPTEDTTDDNNETVTISGTATINGTTATVNATTLTIVEAGILVHDAMTLGAEISTATIAEASSDILYVQLASQPATSSSVTISVTSDDTNEGTVTPATLTFSDTNWNARQPVTVTAVDDNIDRDGDSFMVEFAVMSGDGGNYTSSLDLPSVAVLVTDDDTASNTINLSVSPDRVTETAGTTTITVKATLDGIVVLPTATDVAVTISDGTATSTGESADYTLSIPTATLTITIPAEATSGEGEFSITPEADDVNDNDETVLIDGTATINGTMATVNEATLRIIEFSDEDQQAIEQTVAAAASGVTQVVTEQIGIRLAKRTSAGSAQDRQSLSSIDWQDRLAKFTYEGLKRLDSEADMSLDWLLRAAGGNGQLVMPLGVESLTLWATGGHISTKGDGVADYDGDVNSFILGVDNELANDWLAGVAISYSDSEIDYTMNGSGETEQTLYGVHPYMSRNISEALTLWFTVGYGFGDIDFSHTSHGRATSDVTQWMAAGGLEQQIITNTPWQGALRIKGLWGNAEVDSATYDRGATLAKIDSDFWRARIESEMGYNFPLLDGNVRPYAIVGGRWDHNDAIVSGDEWHIDIGGGVEFSDNAFALDISVRTQITDGDTEEDSIFATGSLTYDLEQDGRGLQIALSRPLNNTSPAFDSHSFNEVTESGLSGAPLTSELAYGWTVHPFGLEGALQTYVQNSFDSSDRHYAVGMELAVNALTLSFETGYHDHTSLNSGETDNTGLESMFKTKIRW